MAWILFTIITASVLIGIICLVIIFELLSRIRDAKDQIIIDGGPPATPSHQIAYRIIIRADEASSSLDFKQTMIRIDFLDAQNLYLTSIAVPCFALQFKMDKESKFDPSSLPQPSGRKNPSNVYKSMSGLHENWSKTRPSNTLSFLMVRREELTNLASIRIFHDCYAPEAYFTLKYIFVKCEATGALTRFDLADKQIRSIHPCPPSGLQVFHCERPADF